MRTILGIERARVWLAQRRNAALGEDSPGLRQRIKTVFGQMLTPEQAVARILAEVQARGDAALKDYARLIDQVEMDSPEVTSAERAAGIRQVAPALAESLRSAARRIKRFHRRQGERSWFDFQEGLGEIVAPLDRVGLYVPGGYCSTVLMTAIPAKVASVPEVVLCTPPGKDGKIAPAVLAAADIADVHRVFKLGGAQAVAAMAFGTQSVPRVDKICGPGNVFVTLAKRQVFGRVAIDGLQGPTETIILADERADPRLCAADLLAQAEHDVLASPILVTTASGLVEKVLPEIEHQLTQLSRRTTIEASLQDQGHIVVLQTAEEAIEVVNTYAPEHLGLLVEKPWEWVGKIRHAGAIFVGATSPHVLGDYVAGPSHVLPTLGTARYASSLRVSDFQKVTSIIALNAKDARLLGPDAIAIAEAEGFTAHAAAAQWRLDAE